MGVENPALLCYELAAVGLPVERPRAPGTGVLAFSVRLEPNDGPAHDAYDDQAEECGRAEVSEPPATGTAARSAKWVGPRSWSRPRVRIGLPTSRPLVALAAALTVVVAGVIGLALSDHGGHTAAGLGADAHTSRTSPARPRAATGKNIAPRSSDRSSAKPVAPQRRSVPVSAGAAAAFEAEGHQLLAMGRYAAAIGALRSAIQTSGGSLSRCAQPTSEACLTYAYALYDLGRALQLDGDPAAAIPILSERLRINNQRETVQQELNIARAARA
jgi:tetratricopeptide (TPR) repeat protein